MPSLKLAVEKKEQRGPDTFLSLRLSEKDGPRGVTLEVTLHNVDEGKIEFDEGEMSIWTKEGAPIFLRFGKPFETMP